MWVADGVVAWGSVGSVGEWALFGGVCMLHAGTAGNINILNSLLTQVFMFNTIRQLFVKQYCLCNYMYCSSYFIQMLLNF